MFVFIVSVLLYLYLSVSLFACLYMTILSVLPEWRINFIIKVPAPSKSHGTIRYDKRDQKIKYKEKLKQKAGEQ